MKESRMRLPRGYAKLHHNLGAFIRRCRLENDYDCGRSQADVAKRVGISRESLSRIEKGHRWPSYDTLYEIMGLFNLEWDEIAVKGGSARPARHYATELRQDLGCALRAGRREEGMTLRVLSEKTGISSSQLSRIERAQNVQSRVLYMIDTGDAGQPNDRTIFRFNHSELTRLAEKGWPLRHG